MTGTLIKNKKESKMNIGSFKFFKDRLFKFLNLSSCYVMYQNVTCWSSFPLFFKDTGEIYIQQNLHSICHFARKMIEWSQKTREIYFFCLNYKVR